MRRRSPLRILLGGVSARVPGQGGLDWLVLQWVLGLRRLGHEVVLVERLRDDDLRPSGTTLAASANAAHFLGVIEAFDLVGAAALVLGGEGEVVGLSAERLRRYAREADLVIDMAGGLSGTDLLAAVPRRLFLDLDPGFTQLWHEAEGIDMHFDEYTHFATVGLCFDSSADVVPSCGLDWISTPQPVVLEEWPFAEGLGRDALTTVANWRGYGSIRIDGVFFGQKAHSLRHFFDLPRRTEGRFELALAIDPGEPEDLSALAANGWILVDPQSVAGSAHAYRRFIQGSRAELGIAKSGYVEGHCGWVSDRSVCYLASGRPVIAQETGFSDVLPGDEGLLAFRTAEDIEAAVEELATDYERHRRAARAIAEEYFASDRVLGGLIERVGVAA